MDRFTVEILGCGMNGDYLVNVDTIPGVGD
jgi:hexokinase